MIVAGLFETGFAVLLKQSHGITRLWPTVGFAVCALISFGLLTMALKRLEVGPAYAVWTGLGVGRHRRGGHVGTGGIGLAAHREPPDQAPFRDQRPLVRVIRALTGRSAPRCA